MNRRIFAVVWLLLAGLYSTLAQAELMIEITKGVERASPIAVVPFGSQSQLAVDMSGVISDDLGRSGRFKSLGREAMLSTPSTPDQVRFPEWQVLKQDYLVIGQVRPGPEGYTVQFFVFDVLKGQQLMSYTVESSAPDLRRTAHRIADMIFQQLTGTPGAFATRIAYVTSYMGDNGKRQYRIQVADADGYAPQTIVTSPEPLMSPAWSADGKRLAYVSFETKASAIYVQELATGQRTMVSSLPGINGAPAWSPDGRRLAVTLSKDGNPDVYVLDLASRSLTNISNSRAIDTEPSWSPDGGSIVFTSDRGGKPQLYIVSSSGGTAQRATFEGEYNARGAFSPDGRSLVMVHGGGGNFRIAVMDLKTRALRVLTRGPLDESPSFAANGSMIMYASKAGNEGYLSAVSFDGGVHQRLSSETHDVREPAWSPF
ncbi:Tol-Pal system beta propeller repeat protein TolB [Methylogaea oryzae]|uniref:Tol-Pal system protein TolB n=1 Tax=Methylogaea oryzae TaxID=1295382 RepID=A0A8D5AIC8_9GAMM|nr:Tol-Pal system beta propeller repeat protein TolB [Methylogaea oryzae]BBL71216.1 protein TolB [Methylogaea oryzae]